MTTEHNHPPRCCCELPDGPTSAPPVVCPLCVEHGELAQLGKECPSCHTTAGHPHTDYCTLTKPLPGNIQVRDPQPLDNPTPRRSGPPSNDHPANEWLKCPLCNPDGAHTHLAR